MTDERNNTGDWNTGDRGKRAPDPLQPLRDIAANNSADPVLANIEQGVRDGLGKAESDTEGNDQ